MGLEGFPNLISHVHIIFFMLLLDKVHYRVTLWSMNNLCVPGKENIPALALNYTQGTGILRGNISWHHGLNAIAVICNGVAEKTSGS